MNRSLALAAALVPSFAAFSGCGSSPESGDATESPTRGTQSATTVTGTDPVSGLGGKCLDVFGGDTSDGATVGIWDCNGAPWQKWTYRNQTLSGIGGKCLDVAGGGRTNGTRVQLWTCNGTGAQLWRALGGQLVNPQSGKCLDVSGNQNANGITVQLWDCWGGPNQQWIVAQAPMPDGGTDSSAGTDSGVSGGGAKGPLLPAGYLSTRGNQLVDSLGDSVRIASIGWPGGDGPAGYAPQGLWNGGGAAYQDIIQSAKDAGFNTIRIAWSNVSIVAVPQSPNQVDPAVNPTLAGLTVIQIFDKIVEHAGTIGMRIIFDHHTDDGGGGQQPNGLWFDKGPGSDGTDGAGTQGTVDAARFRADWVAFARRYAGNPTVIGFDLDNEPIGVGRANWGGGGPTDIHQMYTDIGNAIHEVNPDALIICEGLIENWGGNYVMDLGPARGTPVRLNKPNKLVYSTHEYPAEINGGALDSYGNYVQTMNTAWGFLVSENIAPVWIGEMGSDMTSSDAKDWSAILLAYMNGAIGANGGPTFSGFDQPVSGSWWQIGISSGPDGLQTAWGLGHYRPEQKAITDRMRFTVPAQQ